MHPTPGIIRPLSAYGLAVLAALAAVYLVSQILRNSIGVIAPDLAREVGLSAAELGLLSSAFFVAFACAQIPLGIGIDRFGPKACMLVCAVIAVAGATLFARAATPAELIFARVLMGLGSCCYLMAPLAFFARRFAPDRFTMLAGIHIGLGTLGTLVATAPLAMSAATIGWRMTFMLIAGGLVVCGLLLIIAVPGGDGGEARRRETWREGIAGFAVVLRTPSIMRLFGMHFMGYAAFTLVVGLWGGPYLAHVYGHGLVERGDLLFLAAAAQSAGLFLGGPLERVFGGFKLPVIIGAAGSGL
ncbi:MAG TPA: MFS transporter, partial [Xanthobacteraceae bacterium]|nr:MFS transporter [Xanthobacteraceae bacterium]